MGGKRVVLVLIALMALGGGGGAAWFWYEGNDEAEPKWLTLYGNVDIREVDLAFELSGELKSVVAEEGDRVEPGQVLARLDSEPFRIERARAEARVESQRQVVEKLEAGTRPQEIRQAEADVEAAEARLVEARRMRDRLAELAPSGAASQRQLDDAKAAFQTAKANLNVTRAALDLARAGPRQEEILGARARLAQFEAELDLARWRLGETELRSAAAGVIRNRILQPGDLAREGRSVLTLSLTDPIWVRAFLPEPQLGRVRPGMRAWVISDTYPDKRYEAWVGFISPTAEFTPKTVQTEELRTRLVYEVRIFAKNPQGELRLGMPATVRIPLDQDAEATGGPASKDESPVANDDDPDATESGP